MKTHRKRATHTTRSGTNRRFDDARIERAIAVYREESRRQSELRLDVARQLDETRARFLWLYHQAPIGHATIDAKGILLEINETGAALLGSQRDRALGKPFITYIHPGDAKVYLNHLQRCRRSVGTASIDVRVRSRSGRHCIELLSTRTWFPGMAGSVYQTVIHDISDRRDAEDRLRDSERRYRDIVETSSEGICIVDTGKIIRFVNQRFCGMVGGTRDDVIGRSALDLLPTGDPFTVGGFSGRHAAGTKEERLQRLDGVEIWCSVSTSPVHDEHGRIAGWSRMYTDISERKEVEDLRERLVRELVAAQEAERMRIARELHDQMGQHLVALSLGLTQLRELVAHVLDAPALLTRLQDVSERLAKDVHHLAQELRPAALDHLGLAVALTNYIDSVAERSGLTIDLHASSELLLPPAVEAALYRIAQEALTNVVKHADAHHVSVILEHRAGSLHLIVEDDGVGFDPSRLTTGNRLGLAGIQERAALIAAEFQIDSRPGRGTSIFVRVPMGTGEQERREQEVKVAAR